MKQIVPAGDVDGDQDDEGVDVERILQRMRGGVPVEELPEAVDNCIEVDDEVGSQLAERVRDPDRDVVEVSRLQSYEFASQFSEELDLDH
jgi:hypothetical protein